jgi:tetratricopeptide (TPR) repeat protein
MHTAEDLFDRGLQFKETKDYKKAIEAFSSAFQLRWSFTAAYIEAGNCASLLKRYEDALTFYSSAIETDRVSPVPYYNIGLTHLDIGDRGQALNWFERTIEIDRRYRLAYLQLAQQHATDRRYRLAIALLTKAAYIKPCLAAPLVTAGKLYFENTFETEAIRCFQRAIKLDAWNADAYFQLGFVQWRKGDFARAVRSLSFALNADPTNKLADKLLKNAYQRLKPKHERHQSVQEALFNDSELSAA